jgi:hypothetical protein
MGTARLEAQAASRRLPPPLATCTAASVLFYKSSRQSNPAAAKSARTHAHPLHAGMVMLPFRAAGRPAQPCRPPGKLCSTHSKAVAYALPALCRCRCEDKGQRRATPQIARRAHLRQDPGSLFRWPSAPFQASRPTAAAAADAIGPGPRNQGVPRVVCGACRSAPRPAAFDPRAGVGRPSRGGPAPPSPLAKSLTHGSQPPRSCVQPLRAPRQTWP